jgi:hypothetical protein
MRSSARCTFSWRKILTEGAVRGTSINIWWSIARWPSVRSAFGTSKYCGTDE